MSAKSSRFMPPACATGCCMSELSAGLVMRALGVVCVVESVVPSTSTSFWRCVAVARSRTAQRLRTPALEKETWNGCQAASSHNMSLLHGGRW